MNLDSAKISKSMIINRMFGFTIIEMLIVIAIFCLVVGLVLNIFVFSQNFYRQTENNLELLQNGRIILERISRDLRQAAEMVTALPQVPDNPDNPPTQEIEFQDGHAPSPYQDLGSNYYYIRYYLDSDSKEVHRQYRIYCFEPCAVCSSYYRWNDIDEQGFQPQACNLEDEVVGEYLLDLRFWGSGLIGIALDLSKSGQVINLKTAIWARNF